MAKKTYVGVDNIAREVKKIYLGVDGVARKVKKAYIGDANGTARLVYSSNMFNITYNFVDINGSGDNFESALNYMTFLPDSAEAGEWMYDVFFADALAGSQWGDNSPYGISPTTESPLFGIVDSIEVAYINGENFYWSLPDGGEELGSVPMPESDITVGVWVYATSGGEIPDYPTYSIDVETSPSVTISLNKTEAYVGETITVSIGGSFATADSVHINVVGLWSHNVLYSWDMTGGDMISEGISFTMPDEHVTINAWSDEDY